MAEATLDGASGVINGTIGTFNSILKEFYIGPVQDQLNQEVFVVEMFEKATVDWNGKYAIIPVHTGRNSGVGFKADGAALDAAGSQEFKSLQVRAKFLYGSFQVTGPAISAAAKGSTNSFISYVDAEMTNLVSDVRDSANKASVTGGRIKGFLSERKAYNPTVTSGGSFAQILDIATNDRFSVQQSLIYDGDFTPFANAVAGTTTTWVKVQLYRMDTYAEVTVGTNPNIFVVAADEAAGTIDIRIGTDTDSAQTLTTAGVAAPYAIAVALSSTQGVDSAPVNMGAAPTGASGNYESSTETTGIFGNLGDPTHFSVLRETGGTDAATSLQSYVVTMDTDATVTRLDLTLTRIQTIFDNVLKTSGKEPNQILMNALQRQKYMALLGQFINKAADKASKGDGGFLGLSYGGVPIETSRAISNGCMAFLSTSTWKLCELEKPGFADLDGNVLSRTGTSDAYEGFYRWYWNIVCTQPNANAILCGLTLS